MIEGHVRLKEYFSRILCFLFTVASLISSILSLTLVACDRFFGIVYAMKAHIIERKAKPVIIAIWVISVAVAIPMLIFRRVQERHWKNHVERWCDDVEWSIDLDSEETHYHRPSRVAYWTCVSVILFFLPIIAMIGAYCGIIKTLWSTKIPGERVYKENAVQTKMKRKVMIVLRLNGVEKQGRIREFLKGGSTINFGATLKKRYFCAF